MYDSLVGNFWWSNLIFSCFVIFFGRKKPTSTLMWVMVINFLPIVGFVFYLFLGQDYTKSKMFRLKEQEDKFIKGVAASQANNIREGHFWYNDEKSVLYDDLIQMNLKLDESFYTQDNAIDFYYWGKEKFEALLEDIAQAQHSIDVQYYIFRVDGIGKRLLKAMERKAKEGVRVRLLYDSFGGRHIRKDDLARLHAAGVKTASFFPSIFPLINFRLNYRNHRKIVIIDDRIGYIGGFNVGDDYLGEYEHMGPWRDTHARIQGSGVLGLKFRFLKDWYYASGEDHDVKEAIHAERNPNGKCGVQIITAGPDTTLDNVKNAIFKMITSAKKELFIQSPYFVLDDGMKDALKTAIISGVKVHIMIPCKPDHPFVYWATTSNVGELVQMGARAYTYQKGFLHAKVVLVDDYLSTVGSTNMDIRSFSLNFEANALIYDTKKNLELKEQFYRDLEDCEEMTWEKYSNRSAMIKFKESVSVLLSPLL